MDSVAGMKNDPGTTWKRSGGFDFFPLIAMVTVVAFTWAGIYLKLHNPPPVSVVEKAAAMQQTHFIIEEEKKPEPPVKKPPEPEKKAEPVVEEPIDLTEKPLPAQEKNETVEQPPEPQKKPVRKVYGLKRVYSTGLGAGGSAGDAIIGKHGNTLDTEIDTIKATESDLTGTAVPVTTVTTFPKLRNTVKPQYTKEMLDNRIEGVVRVKITVDIDGRVKRVMVLDDLGYGSKEKVAEACFKMLFDPAMVDETPVATTIQIKIRFQLLEG